GIKIFIEGDMETNFGAESEGMAMQSLPCLRIQRIHIYSHQTYTILMKPRSTCWQEPDIAVS
ncbi:hypothetical protein OFC08_34215, partial [Escherichia coli]|nr:hypothetical protein [Escherichia coli]